MPEEASQPEPDGSAADMHSIATSPLNITDSLEALQAEAECSGIIVCW